MTASPHPSLPPPIHTRSLWQRTVSAHPLRTTNASTPLPPSADVVVIGGGLCGAVLAHALLTSSATDTLVLLEARELASGASGRNAGHCRPDSARGFTAFAKHHGPEQARRIIESEKVVLNLADEFITQHRIDCEWTLRTTYDVCMTPTFGPVVDAAADGLRAAGGEAEFTVLDGQDAREATRAGGAVRAYGWPAATVNPAQLTLGVHALCEATGRYQAFTNALVLSVDAAGDGAWTVKTPRGDVTAKTVVYATNAYAGAVLPDLDGVVRPIRASAHKLSAPPNPAFASLTSSYSLRYSLTDFYSVAPRPDSSVVLGISRGNICGNIPRSLAIEAEGSVDDSTWNAAIARAAVEGMSEAFPDAGYAAPPTPDAFEAAARQAEGQVSLDVDGVRGFEYAWTGIIGCTPDLVPLVGPVPGKRGQFCAVGYNGHGMARMFLVAPALATFIRTGEWDEAMPECFRITDERLAKLQSLDGKW